MSFFQSKLLYFILRTLPTEVNIQKYALILIVCCLFRYSAADIHDVQKFIMMTNGCFAEGLLIETRTGEKGRLTEMAH